LIFPFRNAGNRRRNEQQPIQTLGPEDTWSVSQARIGRPRSSAFSGTETRARQILNVTNAAPVANSLYNWCGGGVPDRGVVVAWDIGKGIQHRK